MPQYDASGIPIGLKLDAQGRPVSTTAPENLAANQQLINPQGQAITNPTPSSVVTSSTGTQNNINNLNTGITNAQNQSTGLADLLKLFTTQDTSAQDSAMAKTQSDRQAQLEKRRTDEIDRLTKDYETEKARTEGQQALDLQPINRKLELLHNTPVGPNAQLEEQLTMQRDKMMQANKLELEHLYNTRENYIAQARTAFEDADYALAESQMKNAKSAQDQIYDRQKDMMSFALQISQENRQNQQAQLQETKAQYDQQKDARDFTMKYGINQPLFSTGGTIFNSQTLQPEYRNTNGEISRISDGKAYANEKEFFADSGLTSFNQIQDIAQGSGTEQEIVLDLIKDYPDAHIYPGMPLSQAYDLLSGSAKYRKSIENSDGSTDDNVPSDTKVKNLLYEIKNKNSGSWFDQWGEAADYLRSKNLNPDNYDQAFWEIFHPKGLKGYDEFVKDQGFN